MAATLVAAHAHALEFNAPVQQGATLVGQVAPGSVVEYAKRSVSVSVDGFFVIGLGRDEQSPITVAVQEPGEAAANVYTFPVAQRQYRIQKIEGVPQRTVTPSPEQVARAKREGALVWAARDQSSDLQAYRSQFQWPLTGPITGVYGSQRVYNGVPKRPHFGVDIARPTGTPVVAPAGGIVRLVHDDMFYSGGTLIIDHGQGLSSSFIHLSKILVKEGQVVAQGDEIALVGSTGRSTGPHLDWRMNWFDKRIDPTLLVGPMPQQ